MSETGASSLQLYVSDCMSTFELDGPAIFKLKNLVTVEPFFSNINLRDTQIYKRDKNGAALVEAGEWRQTACLGFWPPPGVAAAASPGGPECSRAGSGYGCRSPKQHWGMHLVPREGRPGPFLLWISVSQVGLVLTL